MKYHYQPECPRVTRARAFVNLLVNVLVTAALAGTAFTLWYIS